MMYFIMLIFTYFLKSIYFILKLFPIQNKIVFISRQTDMPSLDFRMLKKEIEKLDNKVKIVFVTKKMKKNLKAGLKSLKNIFIQMFHLATSKICITDGYNIPVSVLKHKKELKVFQIWHSLGAIKKFGYQTLNTSKKKKVAKVLKMHKNYDYIISGSDAMTKYFAKAFNYDKNKFYSLGLPRIDYILNYTKINKKKIYNKYPVLKNKKIILYTPTFRDNDNYKINEFINSVDLKKYALIVKIHPNMNYKINLKDNVYICNEFTSLQLLSVADYIITDYSAISIEAAILEKPIYLYVYDLNEYSNDPGINIVLNKELPNCVFENAEDLYKSLDKGKYDKSILKGFKDKYVCNCNGTVTHNLAKFILEKGGLL